MKTIKNISIIGLGAVGCAYAGMFQNADPGSLKIIADEGRIERYKKDGFIINGKRYDFDYITPEEECPPADLVVIATKLHGLDEAVKSIKNHVGPDTIILSLLNGIFSEEVVGKEYGMDKILYSFVAGIDSIRVGNKVNFVSTGKIHFGEKDNTSYSAKVKAVKELFDNVGISYIIRENMIHALWWKFMLNVGLNQASAVLKAPYGVLDKVKEANDLMLSAMKEVVAISKVNGINLNQKDIDDFNSTLKNLYPQGKTSMLQDVEAKRKTEVEMFAGAVCELGKKYGVATPVNEVLYKIIRAMEQTY